MQHSTSDPPIPHGTRLKNQKSDFVDLNRSPPLCKAYLTSLLCKAYLTSTAATDESEIIEFGHLILEGGREIAKFRGEILVISGRNRHLSTVFHFAQTNNL